MPYSPSLIRLRGAVNTLRAGGVVACPTEAVWGLSCDPFSSIAVRRLLQLKNRPQSKGLILIAGAQWQLEFLLHDLPPEQRERLYSSWPGAATWLVPHHQRVPAWIHGEHDTVAVRVSQHPVVASLSEAWGGPLVSTSANPAGAQAPRFAFQVQRYFGGALDDLLPGAVGAQRRPTPIRDLATSQIVRS